MTKAEWSGWMQAVGSITALAIAIAVPYCIRRHELRVKRHDKKIEHDGKIRIVGNLFNRCLEISQRILSMHEGSTEALLNYKVGNGISRRLDQDKFELDVCLEALSDLDGFSFGNATLSTELLSGQFAIGIIRRHLDVLEKANSPDDAAANFTFGGVADACFALNGARNEFAGATSLELSSH